RKGLNLNYFYYLLDRVLIHNANENIYGAKILNQELIKSAKLIIPSPTEQTQIADYLDHKTSKIDNLINNKEKLIELLKEERTSIINQAVTKGLDPNAPMRDSGIDWLGEIPEGWEIMKLRYIGTCQNGISEGAEFFGSGSPFVSYSDVYKNEVLPRTVKGLAQSDEKQQKHYSVEENDVFFTRTSETIEEIGIASICMETIEKSVFAGFLIRFRPNGDLIFKGFSKYYFRCFIPRVFFVKEMNLVTRASLSQELLKRLPVVLPSFDEQIEIAKFLNNKTTQIDKTIGKMITEIELLKEYKTALISEVVTGKVDVRDEKIN
ncbi:MAG TPA: restriction endonuclease subunit S, partial [Chitinophagaceae bacterium]|nr:restriction endonuclease subunit S [Chitinophagaceae bacterium]